MSKCACKGCDRRFVGCHSTCEEYALFREAMAKQKEQKALYDQITAAEVEGYRRRHKFGAAWKRSR